MSDGDMWVRLKAFLQVDQALSKVTMELTMLKRFNYISLWRILLRLSDGGNERDSLQRAKRRMMKEGGDHITLKMWDLMFRFSKNWYTLAKRFGEGMVFYLPTQHDTFTMTWYDATREER